MGIPEREERKDRTGYLKPQPREASHVHVRHQTTNPGASENTKQDKYPKSTPRRIIFKVQKNQRLKNILIKKEAKGETYLPREDQR